MAAKLIIMGPNGPRRDHSLSEDTPTTLGRHPSQVVQILDRLCSKEHASVEWAEDHWQVRDLGSRNGTFVNKRLVEGALPLTHGDKLLLGNTELLFMDQPASSAPSSMTRVTIMPELMKSQIASVLEHTTGDQDYRPASSISDATELRRDYERMRKAWKLQREVALEVDLNTLLSKIMDSLFEAMTCDRGAILLRDEESGELETRHVRNRHDAADDEITISRTIIDQVLEKKVAFRSNDVTVDNRINPTESIIMTGIRSALSVPLITRSDNVLGIIHLDSLLSTNAFNERDLEVVKGLANQAALAIENSILIGQREEQLRVRERFSRLLSPSLVEQLVDGKVEIAPGGKQHQTTVLFTDIRGFTAMTQRLEAQDIVQMLNEHFEIMVDIVFDYDGTLDKFMGDGMMALWGVPLEVDDAPFKAVQAAVKMRKAMAEYNQTRRAEGLEEVRIGIGIDTGELVAGYMGSSRTMNYTVIGSPVNLASRLCSAAGPEQILISDNTLEALGDRIVVRTLDAVALKGIGHVAPHNVLRVRNQTIS